MSREADLSLAARRRRQYGAFTRRDAREAGLPDSTLADRIASGRLLRLQPQVFAAADTPDTYRLRLWAAVASTREAGDGTDDGAPLAALSHDSAANLWLPDVWPRPDRIHVVTTGTQPIGGRGLAAHRTRGLPAHHVTEVDHIAATIIERTFRDVARPRTRLRVRRGVATALRHGISTVQRFRAVILEQPGYPGNVTMTEILAEFDDIACRTRSDLELAYRRATVPRGLPEPVFNHPVRDIEGRLRYLDAAYVDERVPVEIDSELFHGLSSDRTDDLRRENAVVLTGWRSFLRFTEWDVLHEPARVARTVGRALEAARRDMRAPRPGML